MIDLDALQAAAEAATPGNWQHSESRHGDNYVTAGGGLITGVNVCGPTYEKANAAFIAAANPAVILELVAAHHAALARIARVESVRPTWPRGMYGAPQDMLSLRDLRQALTEGEPRE